MKSIKINTNEITIVFDSEEKAQKLYEWMDDHNHWSTVEGNTFTYDISEWKDKSYIIRKLVRKIVYDSEDLHDELYSSAFQTDLYDYRLNVWTRGDKIFRITPVNKDGTKGVLDFGVHQYTPFISFVTMNPTGEFVFLSRRCHVDDFEHHQLRFDGYFETGSILIEVATLQF